MQVRRAAAMDAGHQVSSEGSNALALVPVASTGAAGTAGGAAREPAGLPCPRCDSTDTKFCYYNNYNLGQPRHFCKGCRRYWTRGGALRNVPVGGGTRKPSPSASRRKHQRAAASASSSSSTAVAALMASATPLSMSAPAYATGVWPYGDLSLPFMPSSSPMISSMGDHVDCRMLLAHDRRVLLDLDRRMLDPDRRLLELGGSFTSLLAHAQDAGRFTSSSSAGFLGGAGLPSPLMPPPASSPPHTLLPPPQTPVAHASPTEGMIWGGMSMSMAMGWPDLSI